MYLKRFADATGVRMVTRTGLNRVVGVRKAAVESGAYLYTASDGRTSDALERYLDTRVESQAGAALDAVGSRPRDLTREQRETLGRFVAFQLARSETFERLDRELHRSLAPLVWGAEVASARGIENPDEFEAVVQRSTSGMPNQLHEASRTSYLRIMARWADANAPAFTAMTWTVARADRPSLLASDNPVALFRPTDGPGFTGIRLDGSTEVRLALDPQTLLLGTTHPLGPDVVDATPGLIRSTNADQARLCARALYLHPKQPLPPDLVLLPNPPPLVGRPTVTIRANPGGQRTEPTWESMRDPALQRIVEDTEAPG